MYKELKNTWMIFVNSQIKQTATFTKNMLKIKEFKVRDQHHYTDNYRGGAHSIYDFKYRIPKEFSVEKIL